MCVVFISIFLFRFVQGLTVGVGHLEIFLRAKLKKEKEHKLNSISFPRTHIHYPEFDRRGWYPYVCVTNLP